MDTFQYGFSILTALNKEALFCCMHKIFASIVCRSPSYVALV